MSVGRKVLTPFSFGGVSIQFTWNNYTMSQKGTLFIFLITLSKINPFLLFLVC